MARSETYAAKVDLTKTVTVLQGEVISDALKVSGMTIAGMYCPAGLEKNTGIIILVKEPISGEFIKAMGELGGQYALVGQPNVYVGMDKYGCSGMTDVKFELDSKVAIEDLVFTVILVTES